MTKISRVPTVEHVKPDGTKVQVVPFGDKVPFCTDLTDPGNGKILRIDRMTDGRFCSYYLGIPSDYKVHDNLKALADYRPWLTHPELDKLARFADADKKKLRQYLKTADRASK